MHVVDPRQLHYLHVTPGRVRVRSLRFKRDTEAARRVELELAALPGILLARANATTGSILLHFDQREWTADALIDLLRRRGLLAEAPARDRSMPTRPSQPDVLLECCALIGKELLSVAIGRIFPHPIVTTLLAVV